jgi:hypothetical protein
LRKDGKKKREPLSAWKGVLSNASFEDSQDSNFKLLLTQECNKLIRVSAARFRLCSGDTVLRPLRAADGVPFSANPEVLKSNSHSGE